MKSFSIVRVTQRGSQHYMETESPEGCLEEAQEPRESLFTPSRLPPGTGAQGKALLGR